MKAEDPDKMNLTETAYKHVFDSIVNGKYRAGQSISPDNIVKELNISKTPIREALVQLEAEGLISRNGRFYNVIFLDENEVVELYEIRGVLESEATFLATQRLTPELLEQLKAAQDMLKKSNRVPNPDPAKLADLNGKFHSIIASGSGNRYVEEYTGAVRLKLKVIRTALFTSSDRRDSEIREHDDVLRAMEEGNPEIARDRMKSHSVEVIDYLKSNVLNRIY